MRYPPRFLLALVMLPFGCQREASNEDVAAVELRELPADAKTALDALATADEFKLFSLNGDISFSERGKQREGAFRTWPILGETRVADAATRKRLVAALISGVRENVRDGIGACFDPRHGIQATLPDGTTMDWVICFECLQVHVHHRGKFSHFTTTGSPGRVFNRVLASAGVKLSRSP